LKNISVEIDFVGPTYPTNYRHLDMFVSTVKRLCSKDYLVLVHKHLTITKIMPLQPLRKCRRQRIASCYSLWFILFSTT